MTTRSVLVTKDNIDEITKLNGGVPPHPSTIDNEVYFVYEEEIEESNGMLVHKSAFDALDIEDPGPRGTPHP